MMDPVEGSDEMETVEIPGSPDVAAGKVVEKETEDEGEGARGWEGGAPENVGEGAERAGEGAEKTPSALTGADQKEGSSSVADLMRQVLV
ncbi:hypothetical protein VTN49DRAFT_8077 [Thermomyces lanuginosus]|uniref:uncharacterized protein n=1 Tax=Thermomyces lanuginosus TaxID=5541 RepID=UPI0037423BFC